MKNLALATASFAVTLTACPVKADKLDDIISSGVLRYAAVLDFPPMAHVMRTAIQSALMSIIATTWLQRLVLTQPPDPGRSRAESVPFSLS